MGHTKNLRDPRYFFDKPYETAVNFIKWAVLFLMNSHLYLLDPRLTPHFDLKKTNFFWIKTTCSHLSEKFKPIYLNYSPGEHQLSSKIIP